MHRHLSRSRIRYFLTAAVFAFMLSAAYAALRPQATEQAPAYTLVEDAHIGGIRQRLILRGPSTAHPVVLVIHGGPGANEGPLFRHYLPELERHFLMVYWEQRGTGRSFSSDIPPESMTIRRMTDDIGDVIAHLRTRVAAPKMIILAHSWGTIPGALYALEHPDQVQAYIGVSQHYDVARGEMQSWQWALKQATLAGNARALRQLREAGAPPQNVDEMLATRNWVERFGGTFHGDMHTRDLIAASLADPHTGIRDLWLFGQGNRFSLDHLWPQIRTFSLKDRREWKVPVVFVLGRHDHVVPSALSEEYYRIIKAPCKKLVWFEASAHNAPFEEPQRFARFMTRDLGPWLDSCRG